MKMILFLSLLSGLSFLKILFKKKNKLPEAMSLLLRATRFSDSIDRAIKANKDDLMDTSEEKPG